MPIHPDQKALYPSDWSEISKRIRFERAVGQCECLGECGTSHAGERSHAAERCAAVHKLPHPITGSIVILTTAHLDHDPTHNDDANLRAYCQRCHLAYDADHHRASARRRKYRELELAGQLTIPTNPTNPTQPYTPANPPNPPNPPDPTDPNPTQPNPTHPTQPYTPDEP